MITAVVELEQDLLELSVTAELEISVLLHVIEAIERVGFPLDGALMHRGIAIYKLGPQSILKHLLTLLSFPDSK